MNQKIQPHWIDLAWQLYATRHHDKSQGLTLYKIVQAAISVADSTGLSGFSMSKVAQQLDVATMSIYNHVSSKDELILIMTDVALASPPEAIRNEPSWPEAIVLWSQALGAQFEKHAWLLNAPISELPVTPYRLLWIEYLLQGVQGSELSNKEILDYSLLLYAQVYFSAQLKISVSQAKAPNITKSQAASRWMDYVDTALFPKFSEIIQHTDNTFTELDADFGPQQIIKAIRYSRAL